MKTQIDILRGNETSRETYSYSGVVYRIICNTIQILHLVTKMKDYLDISFCLGEVI